MSTIQSITQVTDAVVLVQSDIAEKGFAVCAVADVGECLQCNEENTALAHEEHVYTDLNEACIYSVGFHAKGLPEIFIFVGPCHESGEESLTKEQILARLQDAGDFITYAYENSDTLVFDENTAHKSNISDKHYWVMFFSPEEDLTNEAKQELMPLASNYYQHNDFKIVAFKPHIRTS